MKRTIVFLFLLLCAILADAQSYNDFIKNYKEAYSLKQSVYSDTNFIYIPLIGNLNINNHKWLSMNSKQKRDSLFVVLKYPELCNYHAVDMKNGDEYIYPLGQLTNDGIHDIEIKKSLYKNWWCWEVLF